MTDYTFAIDSIVFDFDGSDVSQADKDAVTNSVVGKTFSVCDEDAVCDYVSDITGWCVEGITYHAV